MTAQAQNPEKPVSGWEIAAFAAPAAPILALTLPTIMFLPPYFHADLGLSLFVVSMIFVGARAFDIIIDPLLGAWQDRTRTRWGRRRIWIVGSCAPLMALVWLVFIGLQPGVSAFTAGAAVMGMYFFFAVMLVAHLGWAGELIPTYHGRTRVLGAVQAAGLVGQATMLILAGAAAQALGGDDADAVRAMGLALLVMFPVTCAISVLCARERKLPPQKHASFSESFSTLARNQLVRRVLLPDLLLGIAQGVSGGLFLFYFQFVLGFSTQAQTLAAIYFIAGLIGVPLWWYAGRRLGKHRGLQIALTYTALTTLVLLVLPPGAFGFAAAFMLLAGLAQGGCVLLTRAMMADVVDDDELRTGERRSGLFLGLLLTTSKVGLIAGPLALLGLEAAGFEAQLGANNSAEAFTALSAMFVGIPVVSCLAAALTLRNYPLDENVQGALAEAIAARHLANPPIEP